MRSALPALLAALLLAGCASTPPDQGNGGSAVSDPAPAGDPGEGLVAVLQDQHGRWQGTPYRYGGRSRSGVDCSGFVQLTYAERLEQPLPRTTRQQARRGEAVAAGELRPGDLVFFRTGGGKLHVGMYLEQARFLHASTSRGVTISELDNPYWSRHYWQARRVL